MNTRDIYMGEGKVTFVRNISKICFLEVSVKKPPKKHPGEIRKEMFYLTTHSTHFIYGYMASHIW